MESQKTPQEIAAAIAQNLRAHPEQWVKYQSDGAGPACCAMGHMERHLGIGERVYGTAVYHAFCKANGITDGRVGEWNDYSGRVVEDVIAAFDKVAQS